MTSKDFSGLNGILKKLHLSIVYNGNYLHISKEGKECNVPLSSFSHRIDRGGLSTSNEVLVRPSSSEKKVFGLHVLVASYFLLLTYKKYFKEDDFVVKVEDVPILDTLDDSFSKEISSENGRVMINFLPVDFQPKQASSSPTTPMRNGCSSLSSDGKVEYYNNGAFYTLPSSYSASFSASKKENLYTTLLTCSRSYLSSKSSSYPDFFSSPPSSPHLSASLHSSFSSPQTNYFQMGNREGVESMRKSTETAAQSLPQTSRIEELEKELLTAKSMNQTLTDQLKDVNNKVSTLEELEEEVKTLRGKLKDCETDKTAIKTLRSDFLDKGEGIKNRLEYFVQLYAAFKRFPRRSSLKLGNVSDLDRNEDIFRGIFEENEKESVRKSILNMIPRIADTLEKALNNSFELGILEGVARTAGFET